MEVTIILMRHQGKSSLSTQPHRDPTRWVIPVMRSDAACFEKFGGEVTFRDLPWRSYVIEARWGRKLTS